MSQSRREIADRVRAEGPVALDVACQWFPARTPTGHVKPATLLRWILSGRHGVRLEAARVGGRWHTSYMAVSRFVEADRNRQSRRQESGSLF